MFVEEEGDEDFEGFAAVRRKPAVSSREKMRGAAVVSELREMGGAAKLNNSGVDVSATNTEHGHSELWCRRLR
ncbi:hypothetical protein Pcinc_017110 [Petrolisthes cinctipes]|uniref:Uncharacterized protein n=1 Tax=Petrolisthes cinctipes TaxID=88211 RepID=A0AAE1FRD4_PETCI|nr:hypothetical protein Pcinc_017110 [Petrolisthes cinctipes]